MIYWCAMARAKTKKPKGIHIFIARVTGMIIRPWAKLSRNKKYILLGLVLLAGLYYFRGVFFVATVNGSPISRIRVVQELEKSILMV